MRQAGKSSPGGETSQDRSTSRGKERSGSPGATPGCSVESPIFSGSSTDRGYDGGLRRYARDRDLATASIATRSTWPRNARTWESFRSSSVTIVRTNRA